jgi:hypothetical protein
VLRLGHRAGPALARNRGVEKIDAEVVLFIDADCVCHPDVVDKVAEAFADPALVSLMGSYDLAPPEQNFFSQYMNLRHHYVHHRGRREGAGFWAGCGAVRVSAFRKVGGFNAQRYPVPMIEDIELGMRLRSEGSTRLDPELQVTHLKHWTLRGVVETDIKCRAIPWGRLILESGELPNDLNLQWSARIAAGVAPLALLSVGMLPITVLLGNLPLAAALSVPVLVSAWLHRDLLGFFRRVRGLRTALGVFLFHQVHLTYSALTMAFLSAGHVLKKKGRASSGSETS